VLCVRTGNQPTRIFALDVTSGVPTLLLHELAARDPVGATGVIEVRLAAECASRAFSYVGTLQNLYQVNGLR